MPTRNEAPTIGAIVGVLSDLRERGVIDQVVVVDDSSDGTAAIAEAAGAEVHDQSSLCPELGGVRGKGDAMWRALQVLDGDVVCFVDGDTANFGDHFAAGLIGPLVCGDDEIQFVKGFYRRPFRSHAGSQPAGGGRVTELLARPLLQAFYPELTAVRQPLAGEIAVRRSLLEQLPLATGYAVDLALLIDAWQEVGLDGLAQVDLDSRENDHQELADLSGMASEVLAGLLARLAREGRLDEAPAVLERYPAALSSSTTSLTACSTSGVSGSPHPNARPSIPTM